MLYVVRRKLLTENGLRARKLSKKRLYHIYHKNFHVPRLRARNSLLTRVRACEINLEVYVVITGGP
jgi:hypothetical protein